MKIFTFENCGQQLKTLAKVLRWLGVIAGLILFVVGLVQSGSGSSSEAAAGVAMLIAGLMLVITGWIGSLFLYGFGIIVAANESNADDGVKPAVLPAAPQTPSVPGWKCRCGTENPQRLSTCSHCGESKPHKVTASTSSSEASATIGWRCRHCGTENSKYVSNCLKCGESKPHA